MMHHILKKINRQFLSYVEYFLFTLRRLSISMTIGAAPMTRVLSTAAVVHAMEKEIIDNLRGKERNLLVHPR